VNLKTLFSTLIFLLYSASTIPGERVLEDHSIVVDGQKIVEIRGGFVDPSEISEDAQLIDLSDQFVMPGLMDMHVHLQGQMGPDRYRNRLKMSDSDVLIRTINYGMKTMLAGFTTVRDVGNSGEPLYAVRDGIEKGLIDGPRIIAAGGVGITGGHADVSGLKPEWMEMATDQSICDGPYDCRRATRHMIKYGADLIKITSTGGVMTDNNTGTAQQMMEDELEAVVAAAAMMGRKVASHAHGTDGINAALRAGVASIEHGSYTDESSIELFLETGAYLVPTLLAGITVADAAENTDYLSDTVKKKAIRVGRDMQGNFAKAQAAGVKVAFGTDSGVSPHGENAQEAVLMSEAGMSNEAILISATVNAADLLDMSDSIGTLEAGKYADIIATDGSALEDIEELLDVDFVMKGGKIYKDK
jgi:imidazolonepropionase-like amidohydrolase